MKLSPRHRAALVVIQAQHTTNPGSWVLARAIGGRVRPTLEALVRRELIEQVERTDMTTATERYYAYRITPAGRAALEEERK